MIQCTPSRIIGELPVTATIGYSHRHAHTSRRTSVSNGIALRCMSFVVVADERGGSEHGMELIPRILGEVHDVPGKISRTAPGRPPAGRRMASGFQQLPLRTERSGQQSR